MHLGPIADAAPAALSRLGGSDWCRQDQACAGGCWPQALPSLAEEASWMAATGRQGLHWETTSRAAHSHWPHWVATPSSNWMSSKSMPAWAWRAISRSETRRQTQTIMVERVGPVKGWNWPNYKYESLVFVIPALDLGQPDAGSSARMSPSPTATQGARLTGDVHLRLQVVLQADLGEHVDLGFQIVDVLL